MSLHLTRDPEEFAAAEEFLAARIERNLLATVLMIARAGGGSARRPPPLFAYAVDPGAQTVRAAAIRNPPWPMVAAGFDDLSGAAELVAAWLERDPDLDRLTAEPPTARALAQVWAEHTGGRTELAFSEAMHVLTDVRDPPRPAPGALRLAAAEDRELLIAWEEAFGAESGMVAAGQAAAAVHRRLAAGTQYIWDHGGPVSTLAHSPAVARVARIGPVYTPPEHRARGYATAAVAALSRRLLDGAADRCMLFTDLANPTSNKIYASIGYRRFGEWEDHRLLP